MPQEQMTELKITYLPAVIIVYENGIDKTTNNHVLQGNDAYSWLWLTKRIKELHKLS